MLYYNSDTGTPQEGIYYNNGKDIGNSLGVIFLKIKPGSGLQDIMNCIDRLWTLYKELKNEKKSHHINKKQLEIKKKMTVLIGYNNILPVNKLENFFPNEFLGFNIFNPPNPNGGGLIANGTSLVYAKDIQENHPLTDDIIIQIIGDSESLVYRTIIETWKKTAELDNILTFSRFYTGFKPHDKRSLLGFHDGVSNIPTNERYNAIFISNNKNRPSDKRSLNGTYISFIRFEINLQKWMTINNNKQMEIIGRDKVTGCPLSGIDKNGNPIKVNGCPSKGTTDVLESTNQKFRDPNTHKNVYYVENNKNVKMLETSHISRLYQVIKESKKRNKYTGLFRQGFEFFESLDGGQNFRVGLNFISFQNDLNILCDCIKLGFNKTDNGHNTKDLFLEDFITVRSAGIFFIPSLLKNETFPGSSFFIEKDRKDY